MRDPQSYTVKKNTVIVDIMTIIIIIIMIVIESKLPVNKQRSVKNFFFCKVFFPVYFLLKENWIFFLLSFSFLSYLLRIIHPHKHLIISFGFFSYFSLQFPFFGQNGQKKENQGETHTLQCHTQFWLGDLKIKKKEKKLLFY